MASDPLGDLISKLEEIQPLAQSVAALRQSTIEQEAEALDAILEKIRPLLAVVARQVQVAYHDSGEQFSTSHEEYHDKRGLVLLDRFGQECYDRDTRGAYTGSRLILWQDGTLSCLGRVGEFSRWQGEPSEWEVTEEREFTTREVVSRFGLRPLVLSLTEHIDRVAEKLKERVLEYQERLLAVERVREALS